MLKIKAMIMISLVVLMLIIIIITIIAIRIMIYLFFCFRMEYLLGNYKNAKDRLEIARHFDPQNDLGKSFGSSILAQLF